ncbi:O-antigen ligase family protein [Wenyingzhuangia aestuarii]|uniref:O-antigen ligase family protein n=1 Tax=Wenyingzhuangia aestuarii TaxID=1647582 RepID=UPI001439AC81|nr:O-antigen ligase family protein [Wenyingzhuangia aestuarii]NJB82462.1 O-antigen ligase [Wenyingzhuangia aestuarii]
MQQKESYLLRNISGILTLILFLKIGGYFTITDVKIITQIFKVISRVGMTITVFYILKKLQSYGCIDLLEIKNSFALVFYSLYLFLGFVSFTWSTDPAYSALQWFMTFESFVFVYYFYKVVYTINTYYPAKKIDLTKLFVNAIFPIILIFIIGSFALPDYFYREMRGGEEIRLGGWIMNPNELGMLSSILGALGYTRLSHHKKKFYPILVIISALVILGLTSSRSSLIGFLLILGILILKSDNKKLKISMVVLMAMVTPFAIKTIIFKDGGGVEEVMSMTGRLPFWTALLNEGIVKEPFFGYGFMRINYTDYFQGLNTYPGKMTHNTFMQVLMNLGFVGLFIALFQVFFTFRNFFINRKDSYANFFIAISIPVMINSLTEFGVFGDANYGILFWQFLIFLFLFKNRKFTTSLEKARLKKLKTPL